MCHPVVRFSFGCLSAQHNRLAREPNQKSRTYHHSGVYEFNEQEQTWMWSDTASFVRESPGDVVTVNNPCAFNFAGPTSD